MSTDPLDRLLSQTLRTGRTADVCPDAEQLAAFVEHALGRDDSVAMERHLSDCARCAAIVSTLVASEPVATASAGPAWSGWHVWRWAVPTMAAVAIAGLEASRFNSFAYWHGIRARIALPGRAVVAKAPTDQKSVVSNQ